MNRLFFQQTATTKGLSRKLLLPWVATALFLQCSESKVALPIEKEQLIEVLIDIHYAEAVLANMGGSTKDSAAERYYQQIYTIHQVSKEEVDSCLSLLKNNPQLMQEIYSQALEKLEELRLEVNKQENGG